MFRVAQESLTNVRKHAGPGVTAAVSLGYTDDGLVIRVTDDGRGAMATGGTGLAGAGLAGAGLAGAELAGAELAGAGHGLAGMRERIELYGGTVRSGPRAGGGYEVVAKLPLSVAAARVGDTT